MDARTQKAEGTRRTELRALAKEIVSGLYASEQVQRKELLNFFVSELLASAEEQESRETRRRKQAEGIAAAKRRGVQFGRQRLAVPDGFEDMARLWENGGISAGSAAAELGMSRDTFLRRAREYCAVP